MLFGKENKKLTYKDKNGNIIRFTYDRAGRVVEKINALNEKEKLEYDSNDNITKKILYNSDGSVGNKRDGEDYCNKGDGHK